MLLSELVHCILAVPVIFISNLLFRESANQPSRLFVSLKGAIKDVADWPLATLNFKKIIDD